MSNAGRFCLVCATLFACACLLMLSVAWFELITSKAYQNRVDAEFKVFIMMMQKGEVRGQRV